MSTVNLSDDAETVRADAIQTRRRIHRNPELGFEETDTAALVSDKLRSWGLDVKEGVAQTGVVGLLEGSRDGPTVLLRADMDALPIQEETNLPFQSENSGVMHACGHDAHTSINLHVARILSEQRDFPGRIKFIFQPAEEGPGGAKPMIEEGVLENPEVDAAFGIHVWNPLEVGTIGVRPGPLMSCADKFTVTVEGEGGHGASPHEAHDPIVCASQMVTALQTIASRETDPLSPIVVTVGKIEGGTRFNVIPDRVQFEGTVRTYDRDYRKTIPDRIERICQNTAEAMNCDANLDYEYYYPPTINHEAEADLVRETAEGIVGPDNVESDCRTLGGEDFAFFLEEVPGCFVFVGSSNPDEGITAPHHSANFNIDEKSIPIGVDLMKNIALNYLHKHA
jgi:amidohydrolase